MKTLKENARIISEEGELISKFKGAAGEEQFGMETYTRKLDDVIDHKLKIFGKLKELINSYKTHLKEEEELRKKVVF